MNLDSLLSLLTSATEVPRQAWAPILGTLAAWGLTQRLKTRLPQRWTPKARELSTETIAFLVGWAATAVVWGTPLGIAAGFVVGLWSPALWKIAMFVLGLKWPGIVAQLKADQ